MIPADLKERLLKVPGAGKVAGHLLSQGHTQEEAEFGGLVMAGLEIFLAVLLINSFVVGMIRSFFSDLWTFMDGNPLLALIVGFFITLLLLAVYFKALGHQEQKKQDLKTADRQRQAALISRKEALARGGLVHFEEVFRQVLKERYPEIDVKLVSVANSVPRVKFAARMFRGSSSRDLHENFQMFKEALLQDTLHILQVGFGLAESFPALVVDGLMSFVDLRAKLYDGSVLSVKATRDVFNQMRFRDSALFQDLAVFDLRYNDGMEVEALPEEEDKQARILEKLRSQAPRLEVRYETEAQKFSPKEQDGWEAPAEPGSMDLEETWEGKPLSAMPLTQFQELVQGLLARLGFEIIKVKKIPGGTLQILAGFPYPVLGGQFMILARQYPEQAQVHADLIRELDELAREEGYKRGIYLVTGAFTEEAKNISRKIAVDLIDGHRLIALLKAPAQRWEVPVLPHPASQVFGDLSKMTLDEFEVETADFLKGLGLHVSRLRRTGGGALSGVVEHPHPVIGGKFAVFAKQYPENIEILEGVVSEFGYLMASEFCYRGLLLAPATFSQETQALARSASMDLVDRGLWENLRRRHLGAG